MTNPLDNSVQFTAVEYLDQLNHLTPPTVSVSTFFPSVTDVASNGITIELWFKAQSSGSLVSVPMSNGQAATAIAPLIYIDANGLLRAGLFDSTQIALLSPRQNLIASQNANDVINVGALNTLNSPLSVIDGQWHHAALVVQPGTKSSQILFLDGRFADSGTANGNFGLSFGASDGTTWTAETNSASQFGGPITPQPQVPPTPNFLPYAQGFCGCLYELRTWNAVRTVTDIQQLMAQQLGSDQSTYQQQGLVGYVGPSQLQALVQPTPYLTLTIDAPPFDKFTNVGNRVPGYQNYGLYTAIPFTTVAPEVTFQPDGTYSTKISLCQTDQLQLSFPSTDADGDNLTGTFSMSVTAGTSGQITFIGQIASGTVLTITAPVQDCFRFDFSYATTTPCTIDSLQFMLIPGPLNSLMQLVLDVAPLQAAYTDPNYPITPTTNVPDPRNPGQTISLDAYWPLFTDQTVFPIGSNTYGADDLLSAYLNFNEMAQTVVPPSDATFSGFFNLSAEGATIYDVSDLKSLLASAYQAVTGNQPPAEVPTSPFANASDQIYAFIYNVNTMRQTLGEFLTAYQAWAQLTISATNLNLAATPAGIANKIYADQQNIDATLKGPSTGKFIINLLAGSAIIGLGAVLPMVLPAQAAVEGAGEAVAATVSSGAVAGTFAAGAGANVLSELLGTFLGSSSVQSKLSNVSYSTLQDVATNVSNDIFAAYTTLLEHMLDPAYQQTLYSNYGLLQALSHVNVQPLYDAYKNAIQPDASNSLTTGITYASWKALIPSVFTWSPHLLTGQELTNNDVVFMVTRGAEPFTLEYGTVPTELGVLKVLQTDPWDAFYWMLHKVQDWQTGTESSPSGGQFFTVCPIFYLLPLSSRDQLEFAVDWVIAWSLIDTNNNAISNDLVSSLFGLGDSSVQLSLADPNWPLAAAGYGWYCDMANGAVTTPFDAFMNWGEGVPSYSPRILVAQLPNNNSLYEAKVSWVPDGYVPVQFAAAAAADTPPPALVTFGPLVVDFGLQTIGLTNMQPVFLSNNQQIGLQNITIKTSGSAAFNLTGAPTEVGPGQSAGMSLSFTPEVTGEVRGTATISAQGQYGPISFTMEFSGIGIE